MILNIKAANDCDIKVNIVDEFGNVIEKNIKDNETCLIELGKDVKEVDLSFKNIPLVKNKLLIILGYIVFYIIHFIGRLMAGRYGEKIDFFRDSTIEGVHTHIKLNSDRDEPINLIYKTVNLTKNKTFEIGKVFGEDENLHVQYMINLEIANKSFRNWVRDTLLLIGPIMLFFVWFAIVAWQNNHSEAAIFLVILIVTIIIALINIYVKNRKSFHSFVAEWNEKEGRKDETD